MTTKLLIIMTSEDKTFSLEAYDPFKISFKNPFKCIVN